MWLLFVCHQNTLKRRKKLAGSEDPEVDDSDSDSNDTSTTDTAASESDQKTIRFKHSKVIPPRAGGKKMGVFATRSPHRPNPIALSVVRLLSVDIPTKTLEFSCIDLIDGTPILDIKPYHPSDAVTGYTLPEWVATAYAPDASKSKSVAGGGSGSGSAGSTDSKTAAAATNSSCPALPLPVVWSNAARAQLNAIVDSNAIAAAAAKDDTLKKPPPAQPLIFYRELDDITRAIEQVIGADPRSLHNHSVQQFGRGIYGVCIDRLDVAFRIITSPAPAGSAKGSGGGARDGLIETGEVIQVLYYGENSVRPRMRTVQWYTHMQQLFPLTCIGPNRH